jgi:oxygen-dependent protoporphyrinogen oxidase
MKGVRVVVVGGGIAGLAAATWLRRRGDVEIVVLERAGRLGGKLRTGVLAGEGVETGAETFLTTEAGEDSPALRLARSVGLGDELVHPAAVPAAIVDGGQLRPLPGGTLLGVPMDTSTLDGYCVESNDADAGKPLLAGDDVPVGVLVGRRFGTDVVRRLVDPMLGGIYAGNADALSLAATMPALFDAAQREHTLAGAVRAAVAAGRRPVGSPVFTTIRGGLSTLVQALSRETGATVRLNTTVRGVARTKVGFSVLTGSTRDEQRLEADAVILAVPSAPAARMLEAIDASVATAIGVLDYASVALVTLAFPPGTQLPPLSGFLVPESEGFAVKAATFFSTKWPHLGGSDRPVLVRASLGRYGDVATLQRPDSDLIGTVLRELGAIADTALPEPLDESVTRWGGALPQYGVGHVGRVAAARAALPRTLGLAGAAYDGVGIAACVRSGEAAAQAVWDGLTES